MTYRFLRLILLCGLMQKAYAGIELKIFPDVWKSSGTIIIPDDKWSKDKLETTVSIEKAELPVRVYLTFVIACELINDGPGAESVVTAVPPNLSENDVLLATIGRDFEVETIHGKVMKPSLCALAPVDLKKGEATALSLIKVNIKSPKDLPDSITVIYDIDPELAKFYHVWTGNIFARADLRALKASKYLNSP